MKSSMRWIQMSSAVAALGLVAGLAFASVDKTAPQPKCVGKDCTPSKVAEPDKGPPPKCGGKDCAHAFPPGPPSSATKLKTPPAASAAANKANANASKVKQATGGDDGGGDGGLKSTALQKAKLDTNKLAPPPPGNVNKAIPKVPAAESPRDPAQH